MCGIFAYQGSATNAHQILLQGLQRLEYRGYDSAGVYLGHDEKKMLVKSVGKVSQLVNKIYQRLDGADVYSYGLGHTRWATHGGVTVANAHPHQDNKQLFTIVHNGIIENYAKLKKRLQAEGYEFYSDTDTEVLVNSFHKNRDGDFLSTVEKTLPMLHGAYALVIMCREAPGEMIGVKLGSPLVFGKQNSDFYFSSDTQALAGVCPNIIFLDDGELVHVKNNHYTLKAEGKEVFKNLEVLNEEELRVSKGSYKHWMLKEINEQPNILKRVTLGRINFTDYSLNANGFHGMTSESYEHVNFVGCGSAQYTGHISSLWMQDLARIRSQSFVASEYEYMQKRIDDKTLHVFMSQSGETADSLEVLKGIERKGGDSFGIVNVVGSSISRITDNGLFVRAGSEIGVATTKAFSAQMLCGLMLSLFLASKRDIGSARLQRIINDIQHLPALLEQILDLSNDIRKIAEEFAEYEDVFFLGRHYMYPIALECSLKFKEISYVHSEAFPSAELKHGQLALVEEKFPSVILMPKDDFFQKNHSTLQEIRAREGKVLAISDERVEDTNWQIKIPTINSPELYSFLVVVAGQLLSYHVADILGRDIDKPRNLAKSVTVK